MLCAGVEACNALSSAVRWLPADIPLSRQSTGTEENLRQPGKRQTEPVPDGDGAISESQNEPGRPSSEKEVLERSQTGHLDSIAEQEAPHSNGDLQVQEHVLENGHSDAAQDSEPYETLTFHVGGVFHLDSPLLTSASLLHRASEALRAFCCLKRPGVLAPGKRCWRAACDLAFQEMLVINVDLYDA